MKSYKSFIKEYAMGLQVPSMSYMKSMGSLVSGKPLRKKESVKLKKGKKDKAVSKRELEKRLARYADDDIEKGFFK